MKIITNEVSIESGITQICTQNSLVPDNVFQTWVPNIVLNFNLII